MILNILKKVFGSKKQRDTKKLLPIVEAINLQEVEYQKLTDDRLKAKTAEFKKRLADGETVSELMVEAFAAVKNTCRRLIGKKWTIIGNEIEWDMLPYDVQIMGAIVLQQGMIAEMATGEGKTLAATMPLYLNALTGKNVQLVTVNDYLAKRDSEWMGEIYRFLGLSVACLQNQMPPDDKIAAYQADVTYGTNSEFGFDYLRDNGMATTREQIVQRDHYYCIIDEVDSILIDEARTPLIITAPVAVSSHRYDKLKPRISELVQKQALLCNRFMKEARDLLESEDMENAGAKLHQARLGSPKNNQLMKTLEDPEVRKALERTTTLMHSDMHKEEAEELREQLFYVIDERGHDVDLTDLGRQTLAPNDPDSFVLPDLITQIQGVDEDERLSAAEKESKKRNLQEEFESKSETLHNISQLLRAYSLFEADIDYVVQDNKVFIVDEFTGRMLPGRRFSEGLHQALEAKEGVKIERETQTFATITIQNYFRLYEKLAGMTGTAETEAEEFKEIYKLDVVVVPTHEPVRRVDINDAIYKTRREKYAAIIDDVVEWHRARRPILIGTIAVETSEVLSRYLKRKNIPHSVLNAKYHQQEAEIVARAGQPGAVTIATNMAGRGTDIKLGKGVIGCEHCVVKSGHKGGDGQNPDIDTKECMKEPRCGLLVMGTERHESRRIDRQLRGRSGRQGDPGTSRFYICLEDDLMRLFGSERIAGIMTRVGIEEGQELAHPLLTKSIERAQKRVEAHHFAIRKHTLEYDDVMNKQREVIYDYRQKIIREDDLTPYFNEFMDDLIEEKIHQHITDKSNRDEWDISGIEYWFNNTFPHGISVTDTPKEEVDPDKIRDEMRVQIERSLKMKEQIETAERMRELMRYVMLSAIDRQWRDHLYDMDNLRGSIGLRAYGQRDPLIEFKTESYEMFMNMVSELKSSIVTNLFRTSSVLPEEAARRLAVDEQNMVFSDASDNLSAHFQGPQAARRRPAQPGIPLAGEEEGPVPQHVPTFVRKDKKVGRNEPCPCGSGKKFKKCCGAGQ
jgi:preprotein translocase subunit SecA